MTKHANEATADYFVRNLETKKLELYFDRDTYKGLDPKLRRNIKSHYNWSSSKKAWISKGSNNVVWARQLAEQAGLRYDGEVGEAIPFAEQIERQVQRAEARAERMDNRSAAAERRAIALQREFNHCRKDWAWLTQPILVGHAGSERFARQREKIFDRYNRGFEELEKRDHYASRAATARETAGLVKLRNRGYLNRRIEEAKKELRLLGRRLDEALNKDDAEWAERLVPMIEEWSDKLAFFTVQMADLEDDQGATLTPADVAKGDEIMTRYGWARVVRVNKLTATAVIMDGPNKGWEWKWPYAEIKEHRRPG